MRQQRMTLSGPYRPDKREREDIIEQIGTLARSYVPEWHFDRENPDIGSVIALLYAERMSENIKRYNALLEQYYAELADMAGLSPRPAHPAHSIVEMRMAYGAAEGLMVRRGTKLLGGPQAEKNIVFQTAHDVYITASRIVSGFMTCGATGRVAPVIGDFRPADGPDTGATEKSAAVAGHSGGGFRLFDFSGTGCVKNGLLLYHPYLFDAGDGEICMRLEEAGNLPEEIAEGRYRLLCHTEAGFRPAAGVRRVDGERIVFRSPGKCVKIKEEGRDCTVLLLEAAGEVEKDVTAGDIRFSVEGKASAPEFVWDGSAELEAERFMPFGDVLSLYEECCLLHDCFGRAGAEIWIDFGLEFVSRPLPGARTETQEELKVIRRRRAETVRSIPADVYADEVALEYYNGVGWRTLRTQTPVRRIFAGGGAGACRIRFFCPADWRKTEVGGVSGYCVRMRILRADNCYSQTAVHHCPRLCGLRVTYRCAEESGRPCRVVGYAGSRRRDLTAALGNGVSVPLFTRSIYRDTSLYLGFDRKPEAGPVSVLVCVEEDVSGAGGKLSFSCSSRNGFCGIKVADGTDGLRRTGVLLFMPPPDMSAVTLEGQTAYWLKITDTARDGLSARQGLRCPLIGKIAVNGVEVDNIETLEEEEYYMDAGAPELSFAVRADNILSVEVWVNETGFFSDSEMRRMLRDDPETARAEYDLRGNITEFYVKWKEVDNFDRSVSTDRHFIVDRRENRIRFGDGVHVRIPRNTDGPAFRAAVSCCSGRKANVEIGEIDTLYGSPLFVERVYNPVRAGGGEDMESVEEALRRAGTVLSTGNRLVSAADFERTALDFCRRISQAKIVAGRKKDGTAAPGVVTLVVLPEDYRGGSRSFPEIRRRLEEHLLPRLALSAAPAGLEIAEPVYARIAVEIWARKEPGQDAFTVRGALLRALESCLDPPGSGGREIGRSVTRGQISLALGTEKTGARIRRMTVTASCRDETGVYETDPELLSGNPYIFIMGGTHKIHVE